MLPFINGCIIVFAVYLLNHNQIFAYADEYRSGYFMLENDNEEKDDKLNSDAHIPCILDCLSKRNCTTAVINKAEKKCVSPRKQEKLPENVEMWTKMPAEMEESKFNASSCLEIKRIKPNAKSGVYKIQIKSSNGPVDLFCDMTTDSGGWTLVWSYKFTNYNQFSSTNNAVTPIPDWPSPTVATNVPRSNIAPTTEFSSGALEFNQWKTIANLSEFLIKSNINHWISCTAVTGSLVHWRPGSVQCKNVKNVTLVCPGTAPDTLHIGGRGPVLRTTSKSICYHFDGDTIGTWPVHDPCSLNQANQKIGVIAAGGNILIR